MFQFGFFFSPTKFKDIRTYARAALVNGIKNGVVCPLLRHTVHTSHNINGEVERALSLKLSLVRLEFVGYQQGFFPLVHKFNKSDSE